MSEWWYPNDPRFIRPGTAGHSAVITASKVPSICGVSRWNSQYATWHQMRGNFQSDVVKDEYDVGHAFELALSELWRIKNPGWRVSRTEIQFFTEEFGFPVAITADRRATKGRSKKLLEFKTARDLSEWGDPTLAEESPPADYVCQAHAQMLFSGIQTPLDMVVMGPFFKHHTYVVEFEAAIAKWVLDSCHTFWTSVQNGVPPELDNSTSTYACVKAMHPDITPGMSVEIPEALAVDFRSTAAESKATESALRGLKSKVLDAVGSAQLVTCNGEPVARRQPHARGGVALVLCS